MSYTVDGEFGAADYETMLDAMCEGRVFRLRVCGDPNWEIPAGAIRIEEGCDEYYALVITRDQLRALGRELIEYADKVEHEETKRRDHGQT